MDDPGSPATGEARVPDVATLAALEGLAVDLARSAARLVVDERPRQLGVETKSSETDVVTEMDARAEAFLRERIAALRPGDAVLGEEGGSAGSGELTWVLDPIDGTVNYLYDIPEFAVSVAAVVGDPNGGAWRPVAGAVAHPSAGRVYHARLGGGAWCTADDGSSGPLAPTRCTDLALTLLGTGFGYRAAVRERQARELVGILPAIRDIRRGGSAALDLCSVAAGRLDAYYERGVHVWDIAAGRLVVEEAGGLVAGVRGAVPGDDGVVAGAPGVFAAVRELVARVTGGREDA